MESAIIEALATGGPTAILALFIFLMYRRDRQHSEDCLRNDRIFMEDRLTKILEQDQRTRETNTIALAGLTDILKTMNSRGKG